MDTLVSVGRLTAMQRLCRLFLDLYDRLAVCGQVSDNVLPMLMTQEEVGDCLGLTAVHVNRTLKKLEKQGLIARQGQDLILDPASLRSIGHLPERRYVHDPAWMPSPR